MAGVFWCTTSIDAQASPELGLLHEHGMATPVPCQPKPVRHLHQLQACMWPSARHEHVLPKALPAACAAKNKTQPWRSRRTTMCAALLLSIDAIQGAVKRCAGMTLSIGYAHGKSRVAKCAPSNKTLCRRRRNSCARVARCLVLHDRPLPPDRHLKHGLVRPGTCACSSAQSALNQPMRGNSLSVIIFVAMAATTSSRGSICILIRHASDNSKFCLDPEKRWHCAPHMWWPPSLQKEIPAICQLHCADPARELQSKARRHVVYSFRLRLTSAAFPSPKRRRLPNLDLVVRQ